MNADFEKAAEYKKLAEEIELRVKEFGKPRIELLKSFWQAERGKAHLNLSESGNRFKQYMHKARSGKRLSECGALEMRDFLEFLRRHGAELSARKEA